VKLLYAKTFEKDLRTIAGNPGIKKRLLEFIKRLKMSDSLDELHGIRKIEGYASYYRVRIGDHRLGVKLSGDTVELIRFLHRKDIYRRFP
jgi:mRNA interferase RelE/StbE